MKKVLSLLFALVFCLGVVGASWAAEATPAKEEGAAAVEKETKAAPKKKAAKKKKAKKAEKKDEAKPAEAAPAPAAK